MDRMEVIRLKRKLLNALKLSGFNVRIDFCALILDKLLEKQVNLNERSVFDNCITLISSSLEKQCIHDRSIEKEHIERAIHLVLNAGCDKFETIFNVVNAFDFPQLRYDPELKQYFTSNKRSTLISRAYSKGELFRDRYQAVLQRTQRNFKNKLLNKEDKLELLTVDYLLTLSQCTLDKKLILGCLLMGSGDKIYLEDPTGFVELDTKTAKFHSGFFNENSFVLVNGCYERKKLVASTIILPPGEEYKDSKVCFGNINYFGGESTTSLRDSKILQDHLNKNVHSMILFFSDLWLDYPHVFEKLELLFNGMEAHPPVAFIFMGNYASESHGNIEVLKNLFKQLGELISKFPRLVDKSRFVFIPGMLDPCTPYIAPRLAIPKYISSELSKHVPTAIFPTNPCRLQFCNKEIVLFRADVLIKLMKGTLIKPKKEEIADCITRTIISQGHLSPTSLNVLTTHWDYDYALKLYPLPNLIVIGDKSESYQGTYKGCQIVNPGPFCLNGFQFKCYMPYRDSIDDCVL